MITWADSYFGRLHFQVHSVLRGVQFVTLGGHTYLGSGGQWHSSSHGSCYPLGVNLHGIHPKPGISQTSPVITAGENMLLLKGSYN